MLLNKKPSNPKLGHTTGDCHTASYQHTLHEIGIFFLMTNCSILDHHICASIIFVFARGHCVLPLLTGVSHHRQQTLYIGAFSYLCSYIYPSPLECLDCPCTI